MPSAFASSYPAKLTALCALALVLLGMWWAGHLFQKNLQFTATATEVGFWGRGEYRPLEPTVHRTTLDLKALLQSGPDYPDYLELHANALVWQSFWAAQAEQREQYMRQALVSQLLALQSRPAYRQGWLKLLEYAARSTDGGELEVRARQQLVALQRWGEPAQTR